MTSARIAFVTCCVALAGGAASLALSANPSNAQQENPVPASTSADATTPTVPLKVFDDKGQLVGPLPLQKVQLTDDEWRERLSPEQFRILRNQGTEAAFCGNLLDNKKQGVYACAGCKLPLFSSGHKFTSGTGWPSFFQPVATENVGERRDSSHGMVRTEIICNRCDGHLGHVFEDGPKPTGLRYCVNSESLTFVEDDEFASLGEVSQAVFAGGCFWCTEAVFEQLEGVMHVESGYAGGEGEAKYETIKQSGHAECIRIVYDPEVISYDKLLEVHFATHDPTQLNRQGNDIGLQYRTAIFYADDKQRQAAQAYIDKLNATKRYSGSIVTTLEPLESYQAAEEYHQNFAERNPTHGYIRAISKPKVDKVRKEFGELLKGGQRE